jgi:hypothetical protein
MTAPSTAPSPATRAVVGLGALALALFFGSIGFAILRAPFEPGTPWWVAWPIRVFAALIFGSMTGLGRAHPRRPAHRGRVTRAVPAGRVTTAAEPPDRRTW